MDNKSLIGKGLKEMLAQIESGEQPKMEEPKIKPIKKKKKIGESLRGLMEQIDKYNDGNKKV